MSNWRRTWLFFTCLSLLILTAFQIYGYRLGIALGFSLVLFLNTWIFFFSEQNILKTLKAKRLEGQDPWGFSKLKAKDLDLFILNSQSLQSLALGPSLEKGKVLLSEGLAEKLTKEEKKALLVYQQFSLKDKNALALTFICQFSEKIRSGLEKVEYVLNWLIGSQKFHPLQWLVAPFMQLIIRLCISPKNILKLDQKTGEALKNPELWAQVLWKLEAYTSSRPLKVSMTLSPLFVTNPQASSFLPTHPPISQRIQKLVGRFPL